MKTLGTITLAFVLAFISGCNEVQQQQAAPIQAPPEKGNIFLTVDFEKGQSLKYKFVSNRNIITDWGTSKQGSKTTRNIKRSSERAEMVFSYLPIEVDPYGITIIEAKCESVSVSRDGEGSSNRDALKNLRGKTFTLNVDSRGAIQDYSSLRDLAYQIGEKAFRSNSGSRRIKEPDMVRDLIATQWFLWDSVSSLENPAEGIIEGQSWQSQLSVPMPMLVKKARDVTYSLKEVKEDGNGKTAVIKSEYTLAEPIPKKWPLPYEGSFMTSGQFGFFTRYSVLSLDGSGQQVFNIDAGRIESDRQNYTVEMETYFPMSLGNGETQNPKIKIRQTITMEYLEN
ncbi:MAG: hypothetical protein ACYTE8_07980 [Planctomycetota bacterium]